MILNIMCSGFITAYYCLLQKSLQISILFYAL